MAVLLKETLQDSLKELVLPHVGTLFPGCIVGCANSTSKAIAAFGTQDGHIPMGPFDFFDIASVTKAFLSTLVLKMIPFEELGQNVAKTFPMKGKYREQITVRDLLSFGLEFGDEIKLAKIKVRGELIHVVTGSDLKYRPGSTYRYTNVTSMLLTLFLQAKFGLGFKDLLQTNLLQPLGLENTLFNPTQLVKDQLRIVPTEKEIARGVVQDESARLYDEPIGSAGLFSTMGDLLTFGQSFLGENTFLPKDVLNQLPISQFEDAATSFGLGFGLRHHNECDVSNGDGTPVVVLKKNGFSGVHFCVLPENDFCMVVFGNICFPNRPSGDRRDLFSLFHKRLLRTLYEKRYQLL